LSLSLDSSIADTPEHVKNFRPKILVLTGNPAHRPPLVNFASLVTKSSSLLITGHVMDEGAPINVPALKDNVQLWMKDHSVRAKGGAIGDLFMILTYPYFSRSRDFTLSFKPPLWPMAPGP
jgi:hypothetical protein